MAFKLTLPTVKKFSFDVVEIVADPVEYHLYRTNLPMDQRPHANEPVGNFSISFRQGTFQEDKSRAELIFGRTRRFELGSSVSTEISTMTPQGLIEHDLLVTCCGIEGLEMEGLESPEFAKNGSFYAPKDQTKFLKFLQALPGSWISELYEACLEVNVRWNPKRGGDI